MFSSPTEFLKLRDIRKNVAHVTHAVRTADLRRKLAAKHTADDLVELQHAIPLPPSDVENLPISPLVLQDQDVCIHRVFDIDVIPDLAAVLINLGALSEVECQTKQPARPRIGVVE